MTASDPMVRFIGSDSLRENQARFEDWLSKLPGWQANGTPRLFLHTPDIGEVLDLVQTLWPRLQQALPSRPTARLAATERAVLISNDAARRAF